jgi:hypothetical protein
MNDTTDTDIDAQDGPADPPKPEENTLTHPKFEELQILYIRGNQSGRIYFNKEWPDMAAYILGSELIEIDTHGSDDAELRKELEEEAEQRQYALIKTFDSLEDNSAKSGVLQTDYVEGVIGSLGRDLSLLVYTDKIVDRFAPAGAEPQAPDIPEPEPASAAPEAPPVDAPTEEPTEPPVSSPADAPSEEPHAPRSVSGVIKVEKPD